MRVAEIILMSFSFQAVLMAVFFFIKRRGYVYANNLFAIFLLLFAYCIFDVILFWSRFDPLLHISLLYTFYIPLSLFGPLFYFYVRNVVTEKKIGLADFYHFIPSLIVLLLFGRYFILPPEEKLTAFNSHQIGNYIIEIKNLDYYFTLILIIYSIVIFMHFIKKYNNDFNLRTWVKSISWVFALFVLSFATYNFFVFFDVLTKELDYLTLYMMVIFVSTASYFNIIQPEVFNGKSISRVIPFVKYETSGLSLNFARELKSQLQLLMDEKRPFLNPELRLDDLAEMLDISRHHASQIINEQFNMSFYEFVNMFRIQEAKMRLKNDKNQSIENIAHECGFNNRVSFYKSFKKLEDLTPSEYRNHHMTS